MRTRSTPASVRPPYSPFPLPSSLIVAHALALGLLATASTASTATDAAVRPPAHQAAIDLLDVWIEENRLYHGWPGLSVGVVHQGELIWSQGYGFADVEKGIAATPATLYRLGSVSKVLTATAVMIQRDRGLLQLDDPVTRHLPELAIANPFEEAGPVTIRHLLTHTGGLPREGAFPYWATHEFPSRDELLAATAGQALVYPPGTTYKYSNLGVSLLGAILEKVSGSSYAEVLRSQLFEPLGMHQSTASPSAATVEGMARAYMRRLPDGSRREHSYYDTGGVAAAANVVSSVEELARFVALHLGKGPGAEILAGRTRQEMHRLQFLYPSWSGGRGLGFAVSRDDGRELVSHGGWIGGHRSHLLLSPSESLGVVVMTNADDVSPSFVGRRVLEQFSAALARPKAKAGAAPVDPQWLRYEGRYSDPWGWEYRVMVLEDQLVIYDHNYPPDDDPAAALVRLTPLGGHRFLMGDGEQVRFELDDSGRVLRFLRRYEPMERIAGP